jgi:hypothetical protein
VRTRRRILALALPVTAVLLLFGGALTPKGLDRPVTSLAGALRALHIAAAHPGQVYFSNMLVIFGLGTLGISFFAIAVLASDRDRVLVTTAGVIGWFGAFCGAVANVLIGFDLAAAVAAHVPSAAAQILVSANTAAAAWGIFYRVFRRYSCGCHPHRDRSLAQPGHAAMAAGAVRGGPARRGPGAARDCLGSAFAAVCDRHDASGAANLGHSP